MPAAHVTVALRPVEALEAVEVAAGVEGDALHLGHPQPRLLPLGVGGLEDDPEGPAREHARGAEVLRDGERPVDHEAAAAAAARPAGGVEVATLAVVAVVVVDEVPVVEDQPPRALAPGVDRAARERLLLERLEGLAVDPEGHPVVLPGEVVVALPHEAAVDAVVGEPRLAGLAEDQGELPRLARGEVRLEDETVEGAVPVLVHGLREHLAAAAPLGDDEAGKVGGRDAGGEGGRGHLDRLHRPGRVERVRDPHEDEGPRGARGRGGEDEESEGDGHSHR